MYFVGLYYKKICRYAKGDVAHGGERNSQQHARYLPFVPWVLILSLLTCLVASTEKRAATATRRVNLRNIFLVFGWSFFSDLCSMHV